MIRLLALFFVCIISTLNSLAQINVSIPSAIREKNRDYRTYPRPLSTFSFNDSELSTEDLVQVDKWEQLQSMFESARDRRNLRWLQMPKFPRRTTFLYPQDGCFLRAALMNRSLKAYSHVPLHKIYVFGNLMTKSIYDSDGEIYWYFHVALAVNFQNEVYVIDPSLDHYGPISLGKWLSKMDVSKETAEIRICDSNSYTPYDRCVGGHGILEEKQSADHLQYYLAEEWNNLFYLGFRPEILLDNRPPWSN